MTEVKLLRKGGKGLVGTIENAHHHAKSMLPFIDALKYAVMSCGFAVWRQGSNIHEFVTQDGQRYTLRPFAQQVDPTKPWYAGVRLSLRVSRSQEYRLIDISTVDDIPRLLTAMRLLAESAKGIDGPLMSPAA